MEAKLREKIQERLEGCSGKTGFYYKNLVTEEELGIREEEAFQAASVIKLPIFAVISRLAAMGQADMAEVLTVKDCHKVPGCGALCSFTGEVNADIRTLCNLMITISDNTATNMLIQRFGIEELNRGFREIGITASRIFRRLFDAEAAAKGMENVISPKEMGRLLEEISKGTFVNPQTSETMKVTLLKQQINHKICGRLGEDVPVAHKTGEDDGITNDVGIVYGKQPFVVCFASNETEVPVFEQHIRDIVWELYLDGER